MNATRSAIISVIISAVACFSYYTVSEGTGFLWLFQQPTYLVEKDIGLTTYNCDLSETTCKVNFDFRPSIPTDEPSTHYSCVIDF